MLSEISWQSYWVGFALTTGVYYLFIVVLYYRKDIALVLNKRLKVFAVTESNNDSLLPVASAPRFSDVEEEPVSERAPYKEEGNEAAPFQCLLDEVQAFFAGIVAGEFSREELIQSLHILLRKYPNKLDAEDHSTLTQLIIVSSEDKGFPPLSAEEVNRLWWSEGNR